MLLCEVPELQSLPSGDSSTTRSPTETLYLCVTYLQEQQAGISLQSPADNL